MKRCALIAAALALVACASVSQARTWNTPSRAALLGRQTVPVVPVAWSGVWQYTDSLYDCDGPVLLVVTSGLDTLCTGASYVPEGSDGLQFQCDGTYDDTYSNVTCTASIPTFPGCTASYTLTSITTRTGESYSATSTGITTFPPNVCGPLTNSCTIVNRHATRIAPEPPTCATPALPASWGGIKAVYR